MTVKHRESSVRRESPPEREPYPWITLPVDNSRVRFTFICRAVLEFRRVAAFLVAFVTS